MGGDEGTILKHKVKSKEENRLTNTKPKLDILSQCRILIIWIETKQVKILDLLRRPNFQCIKSLKKIGQSNDCIQVNSILQTKCVIIITCTKKTNNPLS